MVRTTVLAAVALALALGAAVAEARLLSNAFANNMVLQRAPARARLYGETAPGTEVTVTLSGRVVARVKADAAGQWLASLPAVAASSTPARILVTAPREQTVTLTNVLFGDVFICSGQSNMDFRVSRSANAEEELKKASRYPLLRYTTTYKQYGPVPANLPNVSTWYVPEQSSLANFSAACWYFAINSFDRNRVPLGLIGSSWGGTGVAAWSAPAAVSSCKFCSSPDQSGPNNNSVLYNGMITPYLKMNVKGFLWYQGEHDIGVSKCYGDCKFPQMIQGWRSEFAKYDTVSLQDSLQASPYLRKKGEPVTIIAHRGAASAAPENTLVAQEVARRGGAIWIEDDVQPSKDGVPIVIHDPTVDRTTNGKGAVRELTLAQLKQLDAGSKFSPFFAGARLPTLAEQLADLRTRGGNLLLELKSTYTVQEMAKLVAVIKQENMMGRVFAQSFSMDNLKILYSVAPEIPISYLTSKLDNDPVALCKLNHLVGYHPDFKTALANPGLVKDLHAAGLSIFVWTPDSAADWKAVDALGVDGIITNRPAELFGWNEFWKQTHVAEEAVSSIEVDVGEANRPFLFVQLAAYYAGLKEYENLPLMRLNQAKALTLPNVGMATAVDLGVADGDIHPLDKENVGLRLAQVGEHVIYNKNIAKSNYGGPEVSGVVVLSQPPRVEVRVNFNPASCGPAGLLVKAARECPSNNTDHCGATFQVMTEKGWVNAKYRSLDKHSIQLSATVADAKKVTAVRHLYAPWPLCTVYNREGFPALPFSRTV